MALAANKCVSVLQAVVVVVLDAVVVAVASVHKARHGEHNTKCDRILGSAVRLAGLAGPK